MRKHLPQTSTEIICKKQKRELMRVSEKEELLQTKEQQTLSVADTDGQTFS